MVTTKPEPTFKKLISQRIRWAAKASAYSSGFAKFVGITVLLMNVLLIVMAFLLIFKFIIWQQILVLFILKVVLDLILLKKVSKFYQQNLPILYYGFSTLLYPFFSMFVAIASFQTTYNWKGRQFKK